MSLISMQTLLKACITFIYSLINFDFLHLKSVNKEIGITASITVLVSPLINVLNDSTIKIIA